jgi:ketosteroid isomerase-like protein
MSRENVEIVRVAQDAFNRGDVDLAFGDFAPDFEFDLSRAIGVNIAQDVYDLDQFRRLLDEFVDSWESFRIGADEYIDAREHVVTPFTNVATGRGGIELEGRGTWVWTLRDGLIVRACLYQDHEEALEAAGLSQ